MISFFPKKKEENPFLLCASVEERKGLRIIRLKGSIDMTVIPDAVKFKKQMWSSPGFEYKNELLDFKMVTYMDTAAIAELVSIISELKREHHRLGVINPKENIRGVFQILKVDKLIVEYPSEEEAIKDLTA